MTWKEKLIQRWAGMRMAHEALQVGKDEERAGIVNRLVRLTQNRAFGVGDEEAKGEPDAMGVHVGDTTQNYYSAPGKSSNKVGKLAGKLALVAALLGSGVGLGTLLPWLLGRVAPQEPLPAPPVVEFPADQDTRYDLHIGVENPPQ